MKILHLFQWKLNDITAYIPKVKEQGFDAIQISPIQGTTYGTEWWRLYQPINLKIGNTQIGTKEQLKKLCAVANQYGIKIIVDVVFRHVAGDPQNHLAPHKDVDPELLPYLCKEQIPCNNYNDRWQCTHRCTGMPMLDYENTEYIVKVLFFLDELENCGVWGFRLDQLKHYELPSEGGSFIKMLTMYNFYGECIYCDQHILDEYSRYMKVLTEGRPSNPSRLIAKFESHDDYLEFHTTNRMTDQMRLAEWDVLVNHCGYDSLYFARPFETLWMSPEMKAINERGKVCTR